MREELIKKTIRLRLLIVVLVLVLTLYVINPAPGPVRRRSRPEPDRPDEKKRRAKAHIGHTRHVGFALPTAGRVREISKRSRGVSPTGSENVDDLDWPEYIFPD